MRPPLLAHPTSTQADTRGSDRQQRDGAQWTLGDLAAAVETTYGKGDLRKYAEEIGVEFNTLRKYRYIAGEIEIDLRRSFLSYTHHAEVAALDDPEP